MTIKTTNKFSPKVRTRAVRLVPPLAEENWWVRIPPRFLLFLRCPMKTLLHVGCGPCRQDDSSPFAPSEWREVRLDINESVNPDVIASITDMSPVADESVDAVLSSHNLEHLYPHEVSVALKEFRRVLKPGGFAMITCPDIREVCSLVAEDKLTDMAYMSPSGPIAPLDMMYGLRSALAAGNLYMAHRCAFTETSLRTALVESGFQTVASKASPRFNLWAFACRDMIGGDKLIELATPFLP